MYDVKHKLAIVSSSAIIQAGLAETLYSNQFRFILHKYIDLQSFHESLYKNEFKVAIIDCSIAVAGQGKINLIRKENPDIQLVLLIYQYVNPAISNLFDYTLTIDQPIVEINSILQSVLEKNSQHESDVKSENLSERETDVLKLLVTGYSAKEIADRLNISVNTVITHRKNISIKTGIKSLAGLTIYAVTRKIISMSSIKNT